MQDIKNKAGEILGSYEQTEITKADTYEVTTVNKDGQEVILTKEVTKDDILKLASQQFNTNIRNYVAGLAREKKDTKTALLKEYIKSQGIDISLPLDELKKKLGM
jgi:3-oxoacyl-[acyl-carrier-protein] synthase III